MKKLLYIFTILASFIVFYMGFQLYAERQYEQLINLEQAYAQEHQQEILTVFLRLDDEQVLSTLAQYLETYSYSASSHYEMKDNILSTTDMIFFYTEDNLTQFPFFKTIEGNSIDFSTYTTSYLSSDLEDEESIDTLQFLDKKYYKGYQDTIQIRQLYSYLDIAEDKEEMPVYIICNDREQAYEQLKSSNLNNYLSGETDIEDNSEEEFFSSLDMQTSIILIIVVSISFLLTLCCDMFSFQKEICIRKLQGMSNSYIFRKLFLKTVVKVYGLFILILVLCYFIWLKSYQEIQVPFLIYLESMGILFFILLGVVCLCGYVFIHILHKSVYLKRKNHVRWAIYGTTTLKIIVILIILPSFYVGSVQGFQAIHTSWELWKYQDQLKNNLFIEGIDVGIEDMQEVTNQLLTYMEEEGAIYQDFSQNMKNLLLSQSYPDLVEKFEYPFLVVNTSYLANETLKTAEGETIDVKELKNHTVLVPMMYQGLDVSIYAPEYTDIIYIENGYAFVNHYPLLSDNEQRVVKNPIIEVRTALEEDMDWTGSCLMLPYKEQALVKFQSFLDEQGLTNIVTLNTSKQLYLDVVEQNIDQMIQFVTMFIIYILVLVAFMYQNMYLYFSENKTLIAINYLSGKSFL